MHERQHEEPRPETQNGHVLTEVSRVGISIRRRNSTKDLADMPYHQRRRKST
jgi:hypothetical protein